MKAYITSIGEPTTDLCKWSLERLGYDVEVVYDPNTTLAQKLQYIYDKADDDFLRVDADVIVTSEPVPYRHKAVWWTSFEVFGMYSFKTLSGGIQHICKEAIPHMRKHLPEYMHDSRPETRMWRLEEFMIPRRCRHRKGIVGIHGFGQRDLERVRATKRERGQEDNYDWELVKKLQEFYAS